MAGAAGAGIHLRPRAFATRASRARGPARRAEGALSRGRRASASASSCIRPAGSSAATGWRSTSTPGRARTRSSRRPAPRSGTGPAGPGARSTIVLARRRRRVVEWLPQETILFDGARAAIRLARRARRRRALHRLGRRLPRAHRVGRALRARAYAAALEHRARRRTAFGASARVLDGGSPCAPVRCGLNGAPVFGTFVAVRADDRRRRCSRPAAPLRPCAERRRGDAPAAACWSRAIAANRAKRRATYFAALWRVLRPRARGPRRGAAADLEHLTSGRYLMELTPREKDKLLLFTAALLAERRLARGAQAQLSGGGRLHLAPRSWKARATAGPSPS